MKEIQSEILIQASPQKVWDILTDFENWSTWNPIIHNASGKPEIGTKLSMSMMGPNGSSSNTYQPIISSLDPPHLLAWQATMGASFLFRNGKVIELEQSGSETWLIHKETFAGFLASVMWNKLKEGVPGMLEKMNMALKEKVEGS